MGHRRDRSAQAAQSSTQAGEVSRRTVVAATVATATMAAVSHLANPAHAQAPDPKQDMLPFLLLSQALTGMKDISTLAPEFDPKTNVPGVDPINIKDDYFKWIGAKDSTSSFAKMLQFVKK